MDVQTVNKILDKFPDTTGNLIAILHEVQNHFNYLPEAELRYIAKKIDIPITQIYSIVHFYNRFTLSPKGKHEISICLGTACHVKGAGKILDELKEKLEINPGDTTEDMNFSLEVVRCIGACSLAPAVVIDEDTYGDLTPKKLTKTLSKYK
ncbi:MAG: NAD(P)H-dependent oxidoreductase subunit E [Deltaproteobacteria bacterium]|nr:MAG: NAD(P)H-dependent oxidoreductase subunit E [Deltaproteobacteria bacterium]